MVSHPDIVLCPPGQEDVTMQFANLPRITVDPAVCTGKACIRGLRFPVSRLLRLLASGQSRDEVLASYPYLEPEDIDEALKYAALLADDEMVELAR
jgi:uncharacterized protein (DUF433 family)